MKNAVCSLQLPAHAGSSLADFSTLKMEVIHSSETLIYTRSTRRHIPEDGILHSHRRENLKSDTIYLIFLFSANLIFLLEIRYNFDLGIPIGRF
jgi:hypothetical protein